LQTLPDEYSFIVCRNDDTDPMFSILLCALFRNGGFQQIVER
jgi:hypothetical protein